MMGIIFYNLVKSIEMKKLSAILLIFVAINCFAELRYFDVWFGINSIETKEKLEGTETETAFTIPVKNGIINIIKNEYVNGTKEFYLYCSERNTSYSSVELRLSIDGHIQNFKESYPHFSAGYNKAMWHLTDSTLKLLRNCTQLAIEFNGAVCRLNEDTLLLDDHGIVYEYENPIGQIKTFLQ